MVIRTNYLLKYIDSVVKMDSNYSGLFGVICIAVKDLNATKVWTCIFKDKVQTKFSNTMPKKYDVAIGFNVKTANWLMGIEKSPGETYLISGNQTLYKKFLNRYFKHVNHLDLRLSLKR